MVFQNQRYDMPTVRFVAVTGIPFYFTALAAMSATKQPGKKYEDYLLINHPSLADHELDILRHIASFHPWKSIIEVSDIVTPYWDYLSALKFSLNDYVENPSVLNQEHDSIANPLIMKLRQRVNLPTGQVCTIYFGCPFYGLRLLMEAFPFSQCIRYDEGCESYGPIPPQKDFVTRQRLSESSKYKTDLLWQLSEDRSKYDGNCFCASRLIQPCHRAISTESEYRKVLRDFGNKLGICWDKYQNMRLLVGLLNLHRSSHPGWGVTLDAESAQALAGIELVRKKFGISQDAVFIKPHPRTSIPDIEELSKRFEAYRMFCGDDIQLPAELWFEKFGPMPFLGLADSTSINASNIYNAPVFKMDMSELTTNSWLLQHQARLLKSYENTTINLLSECSHLVRESDQKTNGANPGELVNNQCQTKQYPKVIRQATLSKEGLLFEVTNPTEQWRVETLDDEQEFLSILLNELNCDDILYDVGACIGIYALHAAQQCKQIFSFEPDPGFQKHILRNCEINGISTARNDICGSLFVG
ncbi:MAG: hypothetical protein ACYSWP_09195 [Planctomycetota bacterium]|jgi:hypothetical protein